jgi:low affinity Fe/Cu permease
MKWDVLILIGVLILALVIFLVVQNRQDEKDLEKQLDDDFSNPKHEHPNIE